MSESSSFRSGATQNGQSSWFLNWCWPPLMYAIRCGVHRRWKASGTPARPKSSVTSWSPGYSGPAPVVSCTRCPSVCLAGPVADGVDDPLDGLSDGNAVVLAAVAEAEGHGSCLGVVS